MTAVDLAVREVQPHFADLQPQRAEFVRKARLNADAHCCCTRARLRLGAENARHRVVHVQPRDVGIGEGAAHRLAVPQGISIASHRQIGFPYRAAPGSHPLRSGAVL